MRKRVTHKHRGEIALFRAIFNQALMDLKSSNKEDRAESIEFFKSEWATTVADFAGVTDQFDETYKLLTRIRGVL